MVSPTTRGDPESPLRWTTKSTQKLAAELQFQGYQVTAPTVGRLLRESGYSLQANSKTTEGKDHPDRDAQFVHINEAVERYQSNDTPTISVDCKKKENIGDFKNGGQEWQPKGQPEKVRVHDFPIPEKGKGIPYGIYDPVRNEGFVNVGNDHETSVFAVESIRRWWTAEGSVHYPDAKELAIFCDGGGSNGSRRRQWKVELARFSAETGLTIHVHHLPPGTSKWNKIEHRLFSAITLNWRGRPLTTLETMVNLIASTTTKTGLKVKAVLDNGKYPTGQKISDETMANLPIEKNNFRGEWNYTIFPIEKI